MQNVNLMEKNVIQINGGITIIDDVSVKSLIYVKKVIFGILMKMEDIWVIQGIRVIKLYSHTMKK